MEMKNGMTSGLMSAEEVAKFENQKAANLERYDTYSGYVDAPADSCIKQELMLCADKAGVSIVFDIETRGWFFKRSAYYFRVYGTKDRIVKFQQLFQQLANSYNAPLV